MKKNLGYAIVTAIVCINFFFEEDSCGVAQDLILL